MTCSRCNVVRSLREPLSSRGASRLRFSALACFAGWAMSLGAASLAAEDASESKSSEADHVFLEAVQPLLASRCAACHGPDKAEGGLRAVAGGRAV